MEIKTGGIIDIVSDMMGFTPSVESDIQLSTPYARSTEPSAYHAGGGGGYGGGFGYYAGGNAGGAKWFGGLSGSGTIKQINHLTTRRNARTAYHETPEARSIVERFADTVADVGLRLEAIPMFEILGISQEQAREWGRDVEGRHHLYAMDKAQHRSRTLNFYQTHRLYQVGQHRDNDMFIRLYYSKDAGLQNELQFEFIDPDQIRGYGYTATSGYYGQDDGIKRNKEGVETGYKVWVRKEGNRYEYKDVVIPARGSKSKKIFMLHGFTPEYAGQGRGFSRLHFALQDFQNATDFKLAHIKDAINNANMYATIENEGLAPGNPFEGILTNSGVGAAGKQFGSNPTPDASATNVTADALLPPTCYAVPEATTGVVGGMTVVMGQKGDKLKLQGGTTPSANYDKFVDSFASYLFAAAGMPLEVGLMKFNQNYSASRGALILFWRVVEMWRQEMAADYLDPHYEMWLSGEIASGRIKAPGFQDPILRRAWLSSNWIGMPLPDIDPSKTAKATQMNINAGLTTGTHAARGLNGSSHKANMAQLKDEYGESPPPTWAQGGAAGGQGSTAQAVAMLAEEIADELESRKDE